MSAQGYLQVHVYTSRANLPLQGAAVAVSRRRADGSYDLLSYQTTDSSGNTKRLAIEAPDRDGSLNPEQPGGFSDVNIAVDYPQYERVLVEDVQIFPGITTLQDVQLLPLDAVPPDWGDVQDFLVTPQEL